MYHENKKRSILKAFSWRFLATVTTALIVYLFTGKLLLAVSVGGVEVIAKMILYFFHERIWNKINFGRRPFRPYVIWFTGLSGAGKSTLADRTFEYLTQKGYKVQRLDGDIVRRVFPKTGFTKEDRDNHIKRVGFLASILEKNGVIVISSFISPYRDTRQFVRNLCTRFVEVHVKASLQACEQRDPKGLYKKARAGEIRQFTGVDAPYEPPENAEITIDTDHDSSEESFLKLKRKIDKILK